MPNTPLKLQNIITALASNPDIPGELVDAISSLYTDLQGVKSSLYGVGRDGQGNFAIDNPSFRNKIGDQRALTLTPTGILNIGSYYGVRPDVMTNVLGSLYAVPQWGKWHQSSNLAGNGSWTWDVEDFNNTYDLYQRTTGNTRIRIIIPGDYLVIAHVEVQNIALLTAGQFFLVQLLQNGVVRKSSLFSVAAASNIASMFVPMSGNIQTTVNTDYIELTLVSSGAVVSRFGDAVNLRSTIEICKVN